MSNSEFLDVKVKPKVNKKNGQIAIYLPKRKLKKMFNGDMPSAQEARIPIRIFRW